jgi:DNA-binding NarL/FixJ family response regulator
MISIAIFENNEAYRKSLELFFEEFPGIEVRGSFEDGQDAAIKIRDLDTRLVLMDIDMPGANGIEATAAIKKAFPEVQVLILTVFDDNNRVFDAIRAGADGYLLKSASAHDIVKAIQDTVDGGSPMTPVVARKVLRYFSGHSPAGDKNTQNSGLTEKEKIVLGRLVEGDSYKMIAEHLGLSIDTIRFHIRNIYNKLHVNSATEAVSLALRNRIL